MFEKKNNIIDLIKTQRKFDKFLCDKHNINYEITMNRFALKVEIIELCAETNIFKYWSVKFNKINKEKALEEYADCLHFIFSIMGYENMYKDITFEEFYSSCNFLYEESKNKDISLLKVFEKASKYTDYKDGLFLLKYLCIIGYYLNFKSDEIMEYYHFKAKKNYQRQKDNY